MRTLLAVTVVMLCACSGTPGTDGGTGGGGSSTGGGSAGGGSGGGSGGGGGGSSARVSGSANAIIAQNEKFLIAGAKIDDPQNFDFQLVRVDSMGQLDTTFGDAGYARLSYATYVDPIAADAGFPIEQKSDVAYAVALQDTKILVGGVVSSQGGQSGAYGLARYSADGVLDTTFGTNGQASVRFGSLVGGAAFQIAQRGDGKIYIGGLLARAGGGADNTSDFGLARFSADGVLDTTFNSTGSLQQDFGAHEVVRNIAFQGNKVIIAGGDDFVAARFNDDGTLDTTFGTAGKASSVGGFAHNMRILASGAILVAGSERRSGMDAPWDIKLVRYTADGAPDATFGTGGTLKIAFDGTQFAVTSLDELAGGNLVLSMTAGFGTTGGVTASVARLLPTGAIDTTFGTAGVTPILNGLPLIAPQIPASPNYGTVSGGRLYRVDTNTFGNVYILFGSVAI